MIGAVLRFLREELARQLRVELGEGAEDPDRVVFVEGDKMDPISFKLGAVSLLLINVEEERALRRAEPYVRKADDGSTMRVARDLRLTLYVLFIARFKQYDAAWTHLSKVMEHLQTNCVFERGTHPELPEGVERLVPELVTFGLAEQNEVWNALRTSHHPSIVYRVNLVALRDRKPRVVADVQTTVVRVRTMP